MYVYVRFVVESPQSGHICSRCAAGVGPQRYEHCETSEAFLSVSIMLVCAFDLAAAGHVRAPAAVRDFAAGGFAFRYRVPVASPPEWVGMGILD